MCFYHNFDIGQITHQCAYPDECCQCQCPKSFCSHWMETKLVEFLLSLHFFIVFCHLTVNYFNLFLLGSSSLFGANVSSGFGSLFGQENTSTISGSQGSTRS